MENVEQTSSFEYKLIFIFICAVKIRSKISS